jgi:hypothetical protein
MNVLLTYEEVDQTVFCKDYQLSTEQIKLLEKKKIKIPKNKIITEREALKIYKSLEKASKS